RSLYTPVATPRRHQRNSYADYRRNPDIHLCLRVVLLLSIKRAVRKRGRRQKQTKAILSESGFQLTICVIAKTVNRHGVGVNTKPKLGSWSGRILAIECFCKLATDQIRLRDPP
ncbi:hypothetical protein, partial [Paraburkholderia dilworthii]|uniref:hypothetical protein n=1 Tax=Paraburkholderia dilworthii TaxID=948106 RepID=UPI001ADFB117